MCQGKRKIGANGFENRKKAFKEIYRVMKPGGYFIFTSHIFPWMKYNFSLDQILRFFVLKPLGIEKNMIELGDEIFTKDSGIVQFIHIPTMSEIKRAIKTSGFELILHSKRSKISRKDNKLNSNDCTFFVCRKPLK